MDPIEFVVAATVMFAGGVVLSVSSFGIGLVASPIYLLFLDTQSVVVTVNAVGGILLAVILSKSRQHVSIRQMSPAVIGGVVGAPIGVFSLTLVDPGDLRIGIAGMVLILAVVSALDFQLTIPKARILAAPVGFATSILVTSMSIGGPFMVIYLLNWLKLRQAVRASMALFYLGLSTSAMLAYWVAGLYTLERLTLIAVVTVPGVLGVLVGSRLTRNLSERLFRRLVIAFISTTSVIVLAREIVPL